MANKLKGFPPRLKESDPSECVGDGWLQHFADAMPLLCLGGIAVFYGGCGTGKTRMSYELAKLITPRLSTHGGISRDSPCIYTTAAKMLESCRQSYGTEGDRPSERTTMEAYEDASLVVIDEIDNCCATDHAQRKLKQVVDERYQRMLPTILISNFDKQALARLLPAPVIDRIREVGKGFHFDWPSYRGK